MGCLGWNGYGWCVYFGKEVGILLLDPRFDRAVECALLTAAVQGQYVCLACLCASTQVLKTCEKGPSSRADAPCL